MPTSLNKYLDPPALDETVLNIRQIAENLEADMQDLPYARPDGLYPDMTVGAVIGADETAQWAQRESTGSGSATVRSVKGNAVVWGQLAPALTAQNYDAYQFSNTSFSDGVFTGTIDSATSTLYRNIVYAASHKYLQIADVNAPSGVTVVLAFIYGGVTVSSQEITGTGDFVRVSRFYTGNSAGPSGGNDRIVMRNFNADNAGETVSIKNWMLFDLTQMFGAGNEPATVEDFERMFPAAYYPYSAPTLKPVQIAGIASTDAQGGELDAIEWTTQTLRAAGSVRDELTAGELVTRVGVVDLGTLTWAIGSTSKPHRFLTTFNYAKNNGDNTSTRMSNASCAAYETVTAKQAYDGSVDKSVGLAFYNSNQHILVSDSAYSDAAAFKAAMDGVLLFYELATPTTQPIDPPLALTYRVQQGGSESIIVPEGEVSATPVLTVAEPVNAGDEFARIWEAIQSLGYTRNAAQLSRPVSLTDIGSIDEVQKDTAEVAEIDTTKEVQE